jgi:DNA anti-recombination protein RmuC
MNEQNNGKFSRRDFALKAMLGSAAALVPAGTLRDAEAASLPSTNERLKDALERGKRDEAQQLPADAEKLSAVSRAESEARYQAILAQYGSRFSEAQKTDLRRLCYSAQPGLDKLRAYKVENGDGTALYLKPLVEREKKK